MLSSAYFRRQADVYLRLSLLASDERSASALLTRHYEFAAKAELFERASAVAEVRTVSCLALGGSR